MSIAEYATQTRQLVTAGIADVTNEHALTSADLPQAARDAVGDLKAAVADTLGISDQLAADLRELEAKRDLIPEHGFARLRSEAITAATERAGELDQAADQALAALEATLADAALPRLDPAREALARQEAQLAIGNATGDQVVSVALSVVEHGNAEVLAALLSPWGRTLLASRGLEGRALEEAFKTIRKAGAQTAAVRPGATEKEIRAAQALRGLSGLAAYKTAAAAPIRQVHAR